MRKPNRRASSPPVTVLQFREHEFAFLKPNDVGPSGRSGGYQEFERWVVRNTTPALTLALTPEKLERAVRYCTRYGAGGPNKRLRNALIPPLRRLGIELAWGSGRPNPIVPRGPAGEGSRDGVE